MIYREIENEDIVHNAINPRMIHQKKMSICKADLARAQPAHALVPLLYQVLLAKSNKEC